MPNNYAGFILRFLARLIDSFFGFILLMLLLFIYSYFTKLTDGLDFIKSVGDVVTIVFIFAFLATLINLMYQIYFVTRFGGTLGKLLFGVQIFDTETNKFLTKKQAFFRSFAGYALSSQLFGYGYFRILTNKSNLGLHDEVFGTKVLRVGSIWPGILLVLLILTLTLFVVAPFILSLFIAAYAK